MNNRIKEVSRELADYSIVEVCSAIGVMERESNGNTICRVALNGVIPIILKDVNTFDFLKERGKAEFCCCMKVIVNVEGVLSVWTDNTKSFVPIKVGKVMVQSVYSLRRMRDDEDPIEALDSLAMNLERLNEVTYLNYTLQNAMDENPVIETISGETKLINLSNRIVHIVILSSINFETIKESIRKTIFRAMSSSMPISMASMNSFIVDEENTRTDVSPSLSKRYIN